MRAGNAVCDAEESLTYSTSITDMLNIRADGNLE